MNSVKKEVIEWVSMIITFLLIGALFLVPAMWLDGRAKSRWLYQTKGVSVPWYEATWLEVNVDTTDIDAEITGRE